MLYIKAILASHQLGLSRMKTKTNALKAHWLRGTL